jgi:hypothetical protein
MCPGFCFLNGAPIVTLCALPFQFMHQYQHHWTTASEHLATLTGEDEVNPVQAVKEYGGGGGPGQLRHFGAQYEIKFVSPTYGWC